MTKRFVFIIAPILIALMLGGCDYIGRSYGPYRYRVIVTVDTPKGVRQGSSVIEVRSSISGKMFGGLAGAGRQVHGEAVFIELPGNRSLVALLTQDGRIWAGYDWAGGIMMRFKPYPERFENGEEILTAVEASTLRMEAVLADKSIITVPKHIADEYEDATAKNNEAKLVDPPTAWPGFVTFADRKDPRTITYVDQEHLDAAFGPGYSLRSITVQLTDDPVTREIENKLPWLRGFSRSIAKIDHPGYSSTTNANIALELTKYNFISERE